VGKLVYLMNVSLDGYVETPDHGLEWTKVDEELLTWFNDRARETDAFLYGRGLYEVMAAYWPAAKSDPSATGAMLEFAEIWNAKPKVVFSSTLPTVDWNSRLVSGDVAEELARLRTEFDGELDVGGPTLAAAFIRRGLVDEYRLVVHPIVLGAGTPFFPRLDAPIRLRQTETARFGSGVIYLGYAAVRDQPSGVGTAITLKPPST
jgi:dihydrofolate reductase